jgi:hypothetical protein
LKEDLVKRVKESMDVTKRQQEVASDNLRARSIAATTEEGIELDDLSKAKENSK